MAHNHKLEIFKGLVKFRSNETKIWGVFIFLSIVTIVEVFLGIVKPEFLTETRILALKLLNWIFIGLTLVKAYYITWDFMHMRDERKSLRRMVVWTTIFLISFLSFITLVEGDYIFDVYESNYIKFDF